MYNTHVQKVKRMKVYPYLQKKWRNIFYDYNMYAFCVIWVKDTKEILLNLLKDLF